MVSALRNTLNVNEFHKHTHSNIFRRTLKVFQVLRSGRHRFLRPSPSNANLLGAFSPSAILFHSINNENSELNTNEKSSYLTKNNTVPSGGPRPNCGPLSIFLLDHTTLVVVCLLRWLGWMTLDI